MAINKNHEFEDLAGVKCAIVEKNATPERVAFLQPLLVLNGYTVMVVPATPPKASTLPADLNAEAPPPTPLFTIGVTDVTFNATNAIFGRLLRTGDGRVVTLAYWQQKETVAQDHIPYFEKKQ
jgi:hypothetical protein